MARIPKEFVMAHADANTLRRKAADNVVGLLLAYPERTKANERYKALVAAAAPSSVEPPKSGTSPTSCGDRQ